MSFKRRHPELKQIYICISFNNGYSFFAARYRMIRGPVPVRGPVVGDPCFGLWSYVAINFEILFLSLCFKGETVMIVAKINNSSSSEMTPKFSVIQSVVYRARGDTRHENKVINKVVDNSIKAHTHKEVRCALKIPRDQMMTIQNCEIISVEYCIKVCSIATTILK